MESTLEQTEREEREWMNEWDRGLAAGVEVLWKRRDDLIAYATMVDHVLGELYTDKHRAYEEGGIDGGAMEDLRKFIERRNKKVQLPMLVIAESGYDERHVERDLPADLTILQIPVRAVP